MNVFVCIHVYRLSFFLESGNYSVGVSLLIDMCVNFRDSIIWCGFFTRYLKYSGNK